METLCKIAFLHLGFYGNPQQQSTSSCFKLTWLLAYLRHVMEHFRQSAKRHAEVPDCPAKRLLEAVSQKMWIEPPVIEGMLDFTPTLLQPELGLGNKKLPKRRSRYQDSAPRLRPALETKDQAIQQWRTQRRASAQESLTKARTQVSLMQALSSKKLTAMEQKKDSQDDTSDEEDEFLRGVEVSKAPLLPDLTVKNQPASDKSESEIPSAPAGGMLPVEDLFKYEAGKPAITAGQCRLCERILSDGSREVQAIDLLTKGNPLCRGCSIIDAMQLLKHPFTRLMSSTDNNVARVGGKRGKLMRPKAKPHAGDRFRSTYSPVPRPMPSGLGAHMVLGTRHGQKASERDEEDSRTLPQLPPGSGL